MWDTIFRSADPHSLSYFFASRIAPWEPGKDFSQPFTDFMLVEREVRDRYLSASYSSVPAASDVGVNLIEAIQPQKLRVRSLKVSILGASTQETVLWMVLVVVPDSLGPGNVNLPSVTGTPVDLYEPASNVIWSSVWNMVDGNSSTGPAIQEERWWGDGRIIELKAGDAIYIIFDSENATVEARVILDMDILS